MLSISLAGRSPPRAVVEDSFGTLALPMPQPGTPGVRAQPGLGLIAALLCSLASAPAAGCAQELSAPWEAGQPAETS